MATTVELQTAIRTAINSLVTGKVKSYRIGSVSYEYADLSQLMELDRYYSGLLKEAETIEERVCEF